MCNVITCDCTRYNNQFDLEFITIQLFARCDFPYAYCHEFIVLTCDLSCIYHDVRIYLNIYIYTLCGKTIQ